MENKDREEYWVLRFGRLYLKKIVGRNKAFTLYAHEGERFETKEDALFFAYGDRPRRGDTCTEKIGPRYTSAPVGIGQNANMTYYLKQEITSVLENNWLWHEKMNEIMLKSAQDLVNS